MIYIPVNDLYAIRNLTIGHEHLSDYALNTIIDWHENRMIECTDTFFDYWKEFDDAECAVRELLPESYESGKYSEDYLEMLDENFNVALISDIGTVVIELYTKP